MNANISPANRQLSMMTLLTMVMNGQATSEVVALIHRIGNKSHAETSRFQRMDNASKGRFGPN
jgi:hypothetical protein